MRLAPKQLRRAGMTGDVPYYGGRLTPWHIQSLTTAAAGPPPAAPAPSADDALVALDVLLRCGVISPDEAQGLRGRIIR